MKKWILVIDTDKYAGNFERELCAFVTGVLGDCGVGEDFAYMYFEETGEEDSRFLEMVDQRPDEHGCCRPCSIWETEGWLYDGANGAVLEAQFNQDIADTNYRLHTAQYFIDQRDRIQLIDTSDEQYVKAGWTPEAKQRELDRLQKEIDRCTSIDTKCPHMRPNNSVAIFFDQKPTARDIEFMKQRANRFVEAAKDVKSLIHSYDFKILGFHLIEESTKSRRSVC